VTTVSDPQTSKVVPLLQTLARRVEAADPTRHREITNAMTGEPLGHVPQPCPWPSL
jgi:succinate-semialdehyde dehydrogenase/glutarate-semialdehyde dehydrogenase